MNTDRDYDLERLLEPDQGEFGALYHRLSRSEPPRRLDRTVLAEAARAVHSARAPRSQRWLVGLGSAAGLVMAAGIAWQVGGQIENRDAARVNEAQAPAKSRVISVQAINEASPPAAAPVLQESAPKAEEEPKPAADATAKRKPAPALPAPAPPPPQVLSAPRVPTAAPAEIQSSEPVADAAERMQTSSTLRNRLEKNETEGSAADSETSDRAAASAMQEKSASRQQITPSRAPAPSSSAQLRRNMRLAPQDWLAEIERLKREGHRQQAIENLLLFRRQYPDWALSDDLRKLGE